MNSNPTGSFDQRGSAEGSSFVARRLIGDPVGFRVSGETFLVFSALRHPLLLPIWVMLAFWSGWTFDGLGARAQAEAVGYGLAGDVDELHEAPALVAHQELGGAREAPAEGKTESESRHALAADGPPAPSRRPTVVLIAAMAEHVVPRRGAVFDPRSFFIARAWSPGRYDRGPPTI